MVADEFARLYGRNLPLKFAQWLSNIDEPLIVVWITGFKPRGDDSRPDRGLVPLARMLFGAQAHVLSIVYGPGKKEMWDKLQESPATLASQNGLWEAVINLSDAIFADSVNLKNNPLSFLLSRNTRTSKSRVTFPKVDQPLYFSEQDVDTVIHSLFARHEEEKVFEGLCNPPGGDWSGVSVFDFQSEEEFRWTSLPRVSGADKRPDHVIQFFESGSNFLLAMESKDGASKIESEVGKRLRAYPKNQKWVTIAYGGAIVCPIPILEKSGVAPPKPPGNSNRWKSVV